MKTWFALFILLTITQSVPLYTMEKNQECPICWDPLTGKIAIPGCGGSEALHQFHPKCLRNWQQRKEQADSNKCPLCKIPLPEDHLLAVPEDHLLAVLENFQEPLPHPHRRKTNRILAALCCCTKNNHSD